MLGMLGQVDGVLNVVAGGPSMPVGKWMEIIGMDSKAPGGRREGVIPPPVTRPSNQRLANQHHLRDHAARESLSAAEASSPSPPPEREKERKVVKKEEREPGLWEPWLEINKGNFKPLKVPLFMRLAAFQTEECIACGLLSDDMNCASLPWLVVIWA